MNSSIYTVALYEAPAKHGEAAGQMAAMLTRAGFTVMRVGAAPQPYAASPILKDVFSGKAEWTEADAARARICRTTQATVVLAGAEIYLGECQPALNAPTRDNAVARPHIYTPVILVSENGYFDELAKSLVADDAVGGPRCIVVDSMDDAVTCLQDLARNHLGHGQPLAFRRGYASPLAGGVLRYHVFS